MANEEHLTILSQGVMAWNEWRESNIDAEGDLREADLSRADLSGANLRGANLSEADLRDANIREADLREADLGGADLSRTDLSGAYLSDANLGDADLSGAILIGADLQWARLDSAKLRGANVNVANLSRADLSGADLRGVFLGKARLNGANLSRTRLNESDFSGADLSGTDFTQANLSRADLRGANLVSTDLSAADLRGAILSGTNLNGADLSRAILIGADLSRARVGRSIIGNVDFSATKGLDTVVHDGPSTIGIDTIYKSRGRIPEDFLRGAGVPDSFITFIQSLVADNAIQFYSCFISYSTKDQEFAERLHADLQSRSVRCWFAPEDVQGGRKLHEQIGEAIRYHDKLLLILSENSMNSEWVKTEIRRARKQEVEAGRQKLFPISLVPFVAIRDWEAFDADIGKDMAVQIREYFVPDFSCWKDHDAYKKAFDRLLRDLKAEPNS